MIPVPCGPMVPTSGSRMHRVKGDLFRHEPRDVRLMTSSLDMSSETGPGLPPIVPGKLILTVKTHSFASAMHLVSH